MSYRFIAVRFLTFLCALTAVPAFAAQDGALPVQAVTPQTPPNNSAFAAPSYVAKSQMFGHKGQFVLHGLQTSAYGVHLKGSNSDDAPDDAFLGRAAMRVGGFAAERLLVAGSLDLVVGAAGGAAVVGMVGPVVGYYQPIGKASGFLPTFQLDYVFDSFGGPTNNMLQAAVSLDFVFHIAEHFALTFGPSVSQTIYGRVQGESGASNVTLYGLSLGMLGWK